MIDVPYTHFNPAGKPWAKTCWHWKVSKGLITYEKSTAAFPDPGQVRLITKGYYDGQIDTRPGLRFFLNQISLSDAGSESCARNPERHQQQ